MLKLFLKFISIGLVLGTLFSCEEKVEDKYIFFLHNRWLEEHGQDEEHPQYGQVEYNEIIQRFTDQGFIVISEIRDGNVNARTYASGVVEQIDSLMKMGVPPHSITIVGTSKGGYIAQYVSTLAREPELNFVFIASFQDADIENIPDIQYCGNILNIFERSDPFGVSARKREKGASCTLANFKEIELNTGLRHGFLFKPMDEWIMPTTQWANGQYDSIRTIATIYKTEQLEIIQLSERLFVHKSFLRIYQNYPCNGMFYLHDGEAVVFDTPTDDSSSMELITWIKKEAKSDIKAVVINHFHIDCLGGLAVFHNEGIPSYAGEMTIALAQSEKAHSDVVPQHSFVDSLTITLGDSKIINKYFGPGHAPDNIVSYVQEENALFGGCLVKEMGAGKGSLTDAVVEEWSATVSKVKEAFGDDLRYVVPGHGWPGGVELLNYTVELFEEIDAQ